DRGSIGNFFSGPEGFNKYRGPIAEGTDAHGGFWESFLEGLANILTFGIVDPEFSGRDASATYDKSGKMIGGIGDLSHTFGLGQQPMGVEIGAGRGLGGILGLALPEYQIDMDAGKHGLRGGILEGIAQAKDMFDPGSVKDTRDWTMTSYRDVAPVDPQHLPEEYETFRSYEELKDPGLPFLSSNDLQVLPEKDLQLVYLSDPDALQKIPGFSNPNFRPVGPASDKEIAASRFAMQQKLVDKGIKESPKIIPVKEKEENVPDPWIDSEPEPDQIAQVPLIPRVQPQVVAEEQSPKDKVMSGLLSVYDPSYTTPVTNTGYSQEFLSRYPQFAKAGGYVHKYFSGGGVEGLINQGMRQQQQAAWQGDMNNRPDYLKPFGEMFAPRPPRGGYPKPGWDRPKPIQGFGFGDQLPPRPGLQQGLDPKTYFHTHEAGQVDYPHFPKKFEPPVPKRPDKPQPVWSDTPKPQAVLDQNYQNFVNQSELGPVDTTQGITATESAEIPNQTLPAPAQPPSQEEQIVNKEVDITMPTNVTADIEFPEQIQGTIQNYGIGGWVRDYGLPLAAGAAA
ncbi:MAG TPA: hypothetical protein DCS66_05485, partial [Flavobacteriaceae bacterium]|nr:hypothetical protein [Flavobacteriaceae bacterium]